ncbi:hypothetical protein [Paenibacillus humicola]|uniref:hypothetical protein n=1 Tax=Paenibacillus humicola TaxID=3110540 RepID=UPI00237A3168|nr:hypothetical protein [Paenibacillus humicola]
MTASSPLVTFIGTTPNIGTTIAALAAAYRISEESEASVGFLCLNLKSSKTHRYLGIDRPETTVDSLRPELRTGTLLPDKLFRSMHPAAGRAGVRILFGNTLRDQAEYFTPEEVDHLLDKAVLTFDVVIADVGAYWDNAATLCALRRADVRVAATTAALSHFQEDGTRWIKQLSPVYGIAEDGFEAIVVHPPWRNGGFHVKEIGKELGMPLIGELKLSESMLSQLDGGTLGEYFVRSEQGRRVMAEPAERIVRRLGLPRRSAIAAQPWYRKLLAHRGGVNG